MSQHQISLIYNTVVAKIAGYPFAIIFLTEIDTRLGEHVERHNVPVSYWHGYVLQHDFLFLIIVCRKCIARLASRL